MHGPGDPSGEVFVEAVAEMRAAAAPDDLTRWCAERGLDVLPMSAGVLLTGTRRTFEESFGKRLSDRSQAHELPLPQHLRETVRSITVLPLPHLHPH